MKLTEETFLQFAMSHYDNIQCVTLSEFEEDLKRFTYLKKLLFKYLNDGELCDRMILNHIIVIFNVFGDSALKMLFFRMEQELWNSLYTFLIYLERMPELVPEFGIRSTDLKLDAIIVNRLRKL